MSCETVLRWNSLNSRSLTCEAPREEYRAFIIGKLEVHIWELDIRNLDERVSCGCSHVNLCIVLSARYSII